MISTFQKKFVFAAAKYLVFIVLEMQFKFCCDCFVESCYCVFPVVEKNILKLLKGIFFLLVLTTAAGEL